MFSKDGSCRSSAAKTTGHVKLDVGGGTVITASITMEAIAELKLRRGDTA
jgi:molybdopterin-binding protein